MQENTIEKLYELDKELTSLEEEENELIKKEKQIENEETITK